MPFIPRTVKQHPMFRIATLGFHAGPVHLRRFTLCLLACQLAFGCMCMYFYYMWNGGLIPWFLRSQSEPEILTGVHVLHHFPQTAGDGSRLTWASAINNRALLDEAIKGQHMMIEGDILLRGQGTKDQQLVPIMAHPPDVDSDITFSEWVLAVKHTGKGIKLDFKSIEAVELVLQTLKNIKEQLRGPLWLHGDILQGPNTDEQPIDHQRFLRLCHEHFPESTISLGWKVGQSQVKTQNAYTWTMVKSMHDVLDKWKIRQPLTFTVRASYLCNSIVPLQWLMEMTGGTLTVFSGENDDVSPTDLVYVRNKLHKDQVYFDLPDGLCEKFKAIKDQPYNPEPPNQPVGEGQSFNVKDWVLARGEKGETIFLGSESVVLQRGQLLSKAKYPMDQTTKLVTSVRAQFIPITPAEGVDPEDRNKFNLEIYLHVLQGSRPSAISGIRGSISPDGKITLGTKAVPGMDTEKSGTFKVPLECVDIYMEEIPAKGVYMRVQSLEECGSHKPAVLETVDIKLSLSDLHVEGKHVAIRGVGTSSFVAISHFQISHSAKEDKE